MVCGSYGLGETGLSGPFHRRKRSGVVDGIRVIEFDLAYSNSDGFLKRTWLFARYAMSSVRIALIERYDLVFATTTPLTAGIPGIFARWLRRKAFVFEVRDLWPELPKAMRVIRNPFVLGLMSMLEWASYRSAHRCVALSPGIADGIARRGVSREKIELVPNGSDIDIFTSKGIQPWRPEGVNASDLMAVFTGTHGDANGLDAVLDAARLLKDRGRNDIHIVLIGNGKLKSALVDRAQREKLNNVTFHDPVAKHKLAGLIASADVGLQCLRNVPAFYFGTSPNKFFDYIAAGLPVLNNYPGWLADLIKANKCGFAVPPDDSAAFADALEEAADNRAELVKMGKNASELAHTQFSRSLLADRWVAWVTKGARLAR